MAVVAGELPSGFDRLCAASLAEGYGHLERLRTEWLRETNRFDAPGETLLAVTVGEELVGIGGLNRDPFAGKATVGRVRRLYVAAGHRRQGVGSQLLAALIEAGHGEFSEIRVRAPKAAAGRFYKRFGFVPIDEPEATHSYRSGPMQ